MIYVISGLHLGGEAEPGELGFRLCTHESELAAFIDSLARLTEPAIELVINGDSVDFPSLRADRNDTVVQLLSKSQIHKQRYDSEYASWLAVVSDTAIDA